ncbi:VOC family protein [Paenibacillus sp. FSL L8-0436]|uniref:VOC family protein n=1 Tax=Paenibacillus sp. FSL L8-0436 TaxID=2954686 RepID=UPI0031592FF4
MIKFISSVLFVKDIAVSRMFYEEILDQQVEIDYGVNIGYLGGFSVWRKDVAHQNIFRDNKAEIELIGSGNQQIELYFEVEYIDEVYKKLKDHQIEFVHDIFEQPWGQRVVRVYDPDKYIIELGEPMNVVIKRYYETGMTLEEVAERSLTPISIVRSVINNK